jgi:hypothetical protein
MIISGFIGGFVWLIITDKIYLIYNKICPHHRKTHVKNDTQRLLVWAGGCCYSANQIAKQSHLWVELYLDRLAATKLINKESGI